VADVIADLSYSAAGRAEPIRLALVAKGIEYEEQTVDYAAMKRDSDKYPFLQCPR
jgi:hypothetical protein